MRALHAVFLWIAAGFGVGFVPRAPGTFGSLPALVFFLATAEAAWPQRIGLFALLFLVGWFVSEIAGRYWGHDHARIVIDEVAAQYFVWLAVPDITWPWLLAGFVLFRLFDVTKPPPARWFDDQKGGFHTMTDDFFAGVYAAATLLAIRFTLTAVYP